MERINRMTAEVNRGNVSIAVEFVALLPGLSRKPRRRFGTAEPADCAVLGMNVESIRVLVRSVSAQAKTE